MNRRIFFGIFLVSCPLIFLKSGIKPGITFCDVGQGDAAVIVAEDKSVVLSDCGPDGLAIECLGKRLGFWNRKIDALIISHPHSDHFLGCLSLLPRYKVGHLFIGSNDDADDGFASLISSLRKSGTEIHYPISGDRLDFADQCQLDFLPPVDAANNANDNSLGFLFNCFGTSMLSLGDLGSFGEENLVNNHQGRLAAEIFKVSHHGSSSSNSNKLLSEVHPALAIISVGEGNSYGHPSQETIERLYDSGARIWRTDLDGELNILF